MSSPADLESPCLCPARSRYRGAELLEGAELPDVNWKVTPPRLVNKVDSGLNSGCLTAWWVSMRL
jgi:hypothetical protein